MDFCTDYRIYYSAPEKKKKEEEEEEEEGENKGISYSKILVSKWDKTCFEKASSFQNNGPVIFPIAA